MGSDHGIVDLNVDDQLLLAILTTVVGEDNGLCLVVLNIVVGSEDEMGAAPLALRGAADLKAE